LFSLIHTFCFPALIKESVLRHVPRDDTAAVSAILKRIWSLNRGDNNIEAAIVSLLGIYPVPKAVVESIVAFFLSHEGFVEPDDDFSLQYSDSTKSKELSSLDGESIETETPILNPVTATPHEPANDDPNGDEANNASDLITGNQLLPDGTGEPVTTDPMNLNVDVAATGPSDKPTPLDTKQHSTDSTTHQLNNQITQSATSTSDAEVSGDDDGKKNCCCTIA
jgi:hypothetical protein